MSLKSKLKSAIKRLLLPHGERPQVIRGGALRGRRMLLDLQSDTQVWRGVYERGLQDWLRDTVRADSVCLDVGAAEGWATLQMALLAPQGRVFAFEPSTRGRTIRPNLDLNHDQQLAEVRIETCYVGAGNGPAPDGVPFVSLDSFARSHGLERIDVVKIDVDGPEVDVLAGAEEIIKRFRPALAVETHSRELTRAVVDRLGDWGYRTRIEEPPAYEHRPIDYNPTVYARAPHD